MARVVAAVEARGPANRKNAQGCNDNFFVPNSLKRQPGVDMSVKGYETIGEILSSAVPRELMLSLQQMIPSAVEKVRVTSESWLPGHRTSIEGYTRHFALNEVLVKCLEECGIPHPPLRGNAIMVGRVGIVSVARVHMSHWQWDNSRRSKSKVKLCKPNYQAKQAVQGDLYEGEVSIDDMTVFLVTEGNGSNGDTPIYIVVPDETMDMRSPLFKEDLSTFMQRYQKSHDVVDNAKPQLKAGIKKQDKQENDNKT